MSTATTEEAPKSRVELLESGAFERVDGKTGDRLTLGHHNPETGVLTFITTNPAIRNGMRGVLKQKGIKFTELTEEQIRKGLPAEKQPAAAARADWRDGLNAKQVKAMRRLRRENNFPEIDVERTDTKAPRLGKMGDKNPEYVLWLLRYKPAKFAIKYGIIGEAMVRKFKLVKDPESLAMKKLFWDEDCVMTKRKTSLTEKPSQVGGLNSEEEPEGQDDAG